MKKVLIIGNSFGQDSARYLNGISRALGKEIQVVNLYIGGCSLYRHYRNMLSEEDAYAYEINGQETKLFVSLKKALLLDEWDYVVLHQASPKSSEYETYQPYANELAAYIRKLCPPAKIVLQMTWTFDEGHKRFLLTPYRTRAEMFPPLVAAYERTAGDIKADIFLPTGKAMWKLYDIYGAGIYRDGFHCNLGYTRYMIACEWFMALTGKSALGCKFDDFDVPVTEEEKRTAEKTAYDTLIEAGFEIR